MSINFTPTSVVKAAVRKFTTPIISAATFDANIAALRAVENPLGATDYQTAEETIPGVVVAAEFPIRQPSPTSLPRVWCAGVSLSLRPPARPTMISLQRSSRTRLSPATMGGYDR